MRYRPATVLPGPMARHTRMHHASIHFEPKPSRDSEPRGRNGPYAYDPMVSPRSRFVGLGVLDLVWLERLEQRGAPIDPDAVRRNRRWEQRARRSGRHGWPSPSLLLREG